MHLNCVNLHVCVCAREEKGSIVMEKSSPWKTSSFLNAILCLLAGCVCVCVCLLFGRIDTTLSSPPPVHHHHPPFGPPRQSLYLSVLLPLLPDPLAAFILVIVCVCVCLEPHFHILLLHPSTTNSCQSKHPKSRQAA